MNISFVNNKAYPCGCFAEFSDGEGQYSDVITVSLCPKHSPEISPKDEAKIKGYSLRASGDWIRD